MNHAGQVACKPEAEVQTSQRTANDCGWAYEVCACVYMHAYGATAPTNGIPAEPTRRIVSTGSGFIVGSRCTVYLTCPYVARRNSTMAIW